MRDMQRYHTNVLCLILGLFYTTFSNAQELYQDALHKLDFKHIQFKPVAPIRKSSVKEETAQYSIDKHTVLFTITSDNEKSITYNNKLLKISPSQQGVVQRVIDNRPYINCKYYYFKYAKLEYLCVISNDDGGNGIVLICLTQSWVSAMRSNGNMTLKEQLNDFNNDGKLDFIDLLPIKFDATIHGYNLKYYSLENRKWRHKRSRYNKMTFLENRKTNKIEYVSRKKADKLLLDKETY